MTDRGDVIRRVAPPVLLVVAILLAWEAYVRIAGLDPIVLPPPSRVLTALWDARDVAVTHLSPP